MIMLLNQDIDRESHQRMISKLKEKTAILRKDRIARKQRNRIHEILPIRHSTFKQFDWVLYERFCGDKTKIAWFDIPGKIAFSRR